MRLSTSETSTGHGNEWRNSINFDFDANAAGWPLVRSGEVPAMEGEAGIACQGGDNSRSVDKLAQEVEDLIERQPQFAFLKPCRQLEKHYARRKNAMTAASNSSSFRHSIAPTSAKVSNDKKAGLLLQSNACIYGRLLEEGQPKPASANAGTIRELLSCEGIELTGFTVEGQSGTQGAPSSARVMTKERHQPTPAARRHGSSMGHFHRLSGEKIWRISSTRCSIHEKEAHIDLVNPAAAQFLVEMSPGTNSASPPAVAVPFKWEDTPGRAKGHTAATALPRLQLPPRLAAVPKPETTFSRQLQVSVMSHPLSALFPCIGANSPSPSRPPLDQQQQRHIQQQQQDHIMWMRYRASKSYGGVYCHARKQSKSFSQPLVSADQSPSMGVKPRRRLFSSELGSLSSTDACTSSSSILHGSRQSSSSRTYLSCELGASTPRTVGSKSSSSVSYDSIGEDFEHDEGSATSPHYSTNEAPGSKSRRHRRAESKGLLKLCKRHGNCLRKSRSRRHVCSPEVWAPTLATYFQRLDVNEEPLLEKQAAAPTSSGYLNSKGEPQPLHTAQTVAPTSSKSLNSTGEPIQLHSTLTATPTSSGYLSSKGEPQPLHHPRGASPTFSKSLNSKTSPAPRRGGQDATAAPRHSATSRDESTPLHGVGVGDGDGGSSSSSDASPRRPTRLPYKMPSFAEQERGRCRSSTAPRSTSLSMDSQCRSPAYAAALELLSPAAVTLMGSRRHQRHGTPRAMAPPKPHRRVQFLISMCKTLKRVLFRQQPRRSVIGTRLMYHDDRAPTTFQFSKPN